MQKQTNKVLRLSLYINIYIYIYIRYIYIRYIYIYTNVQDTILYRAYIACSWEIFDHLWLCDWYIYIYIYIFIYIYIILIQNSNIKAVW